MLIKVFKYFSMPHKVFKLLSKLSITFFKNDTISSEFVSLFFLLSIGSNLSKSVMNTTGVSNDLCESQTMHHWSALFYQ